MVGKRIVVLVFIASLLIGGGIGGGIVVAAQIQGGSTRLAGTAQAVRVSSTDTANFIVVDTFFTIASAPIAIPAGETDLVLARWTASTSCQAPAGDTNECFVQL